MRILRTLTIALLLAASLPAAAGGTSTCEVRTGKHDLTGHANPKGHGRRCYMAAPASIEVSKVGGLGQIDVHKKVAAVVQRDEGLVALVDIAKPSKPKVLGRYEDTVAGSLDGDVSFSDDGDWLFYARQTSDFDEDGIHVLNVADKTAPTLSTFHPGGGAFRLDYYKDDAGEWLAVLDAIDGLVVYRFVRETGAIVKVFQDAAPALKVGGPASAGVHIVAKDPLSDTPLMYVTTGMTGLQIYDFSDPVSPQIVGEWSDVGLADVDVKTTKKRRTVYAATEYWFDPSLPPQVLVLDATDLGSIEKVATRSLGLPADDMWRVQGIDMAYDGLYVAHSHAGVLRLRGKRILGHAAFPGPHNEGAGYNAAPYAMDVVVESRGYVLITDASSGRLHITAPNIPGSFAKGP
jgi:hypothetical protein